MKRIRTETMKFTVDDIEKLITNHLKEVEKITGSFEIKWLVYAKEKNSVALEVTSNQHLTTRSI